MTTHYSVGCPEVGPGTEKGGWRENWGNPTQFELQVIVTHPCRFLSSDGHAPGRRMLTTGKTQSGAWNSLYSLCHFSVTNSFI